jgi:protein TonB
MPKHFPPMNKFLRTLFCLAGLLTAGVVRAADTEPPVPVRTVAPEYPATMKASNTSGVVVLLCEIDDKGSVTDAKVSKSTNEAFNQAAIEAVGKWKFRPAKKDGHPVAIRINLPVKFTTEG